MQITISIETLQELSESIQQDLICLLDSQFGEVEYLDDVTTLACQIVVDRVKELLLSEKETAQ